MKLRSKHVWLFLVILVAGIVAFGLAVTPKPARPQPNAAKNSTPSQLAETKRLLDLLNNRDASIRDRAVAANAVGRGRISEAFDALAEITADRSEPTMLRYKTARALGVLANEEAVPILSGIVFDESEDRHLRVVSTLALGNVGTQASVDKLAKTLTDQDKGLRFKGVQALEKTGQASALEHVRKALTDADRFVRARAIRALGKLGNQSHVSLVREILEKQKGRSNFITIACITALGNLGGNEAEAIIADFSDDSSEFIRLNAKWALAKITEGRTR